MTSSDAFAPLPSSPKHPNQQPSVDGVCCMPIPATAPVPRLEHYQFGAPIQQWLYRDAAGALLGIACRYKAEDGKQTRIWTCWQSESGRIQWRCKHWPKPKPLYGLDRLAARPEAPIVLCEGEKAAEAAHILMPGHVAMCWPGGAKALQQIDWAPLKGRIIVLWPDHDEAGTSAMSEAATLLDELGASSVQSLNLGALAAYLASGCSGTKPIALLRAKDDAADLLGREQWTQSTMAAFLSLPGMLMDPIILPKEANHHIALIAAIDDWLEKQAFDFNAIGHCLQNGKPASRSGSLALHCAHAIKKKMKASEASVTSIVTTISQERASARYDMLVNGFCGKTTTEKGLFALAHWCQLLGPDMKDDGMDGLIYHVMRHWMWLVKRSAVGLPRAHDIMPIFYNPIQGNGKSTAVRKLCSPFTELCEPINADVLTDARRATELESYLVGIWDELEGADKHDLNQIKSAITSVTRSYRILGTHQNAQIQRRMNFIGTSNQPVNHIFNDITGARRYFQIETHDKLDWDEINGFDYELLWQCVSEKDEPPINQMLPELMKHQQQLVHEDSVSLWLQHLNLDGFSWEPIHGQMVHVPAYDHSKGERSEHIRWRYIYWARLQGEYVMNGNRFWQRLKDAGILKLRPRDEGGRRIPWLYYYPAKYLPDHMTHLDSPE